MAGKTINGSCLCGSIGYRVHGDMGIFQYCHCSRCRKFTGSAFAANLLVAPADFEWTHGEQLLGRYELSEARHFATAFCTLCGSSLPWLGQTGKAVVVPCGSLDDDPGIRPSQNIFYDSHASWYLEPASLPQYAELPDKAK